MSDITPWNSQGLGGSAAARQGRRELQSIAVDHMLKSAREQAVAAETAIAVNNTVALVRIAKDVLKDCPEAAPLVMPLVESYAYGARLRLAFGL